MSSQERVLVCRYSVVVVDYADRQGVILRHWGAKTWMGSRLDWHGKNDTATPRWPLHIILTYTTVNDGLAR